MATVNTNVVIAGATNGQGFQQVHAKVNSGFPIHQGDLVYLDSSAHYLKPLDNDTDAALLMGVALDPSVASSNLDNSSSITEKGIVVGWGLLASLKTTATETYVDGTVVYAGADAQTITTSAGSNPVGVVILPTTVASVTGAAGVTVPVYIKNNVL